MKRMISFLLCLILMAGWALPVSAAVPEIIFTGDSGFAPGCTVTVDVDATGESIFEYGSESEQEAYLEGNIQYYWMRNDSYYADGSSITIREEDRGCQFYCMGAVYGDADHTQQISTVYSAKFTVPNRTDPSAYPEITTTELPNAVVGQEYYFKLKCTDPDVTYSLFRSSLPDGLNLTQYGEIEGTPTKEGFWYVVIMATPEAGEDYATTAEFEFYVYEQDSDYTLEIMRLPDKLTYYQGEKLDMTGAWVRIWGPEGVLDSYDGEYLEYSTRALVTVGEQKMQIAYGDAMDVFYIEVLEKPDFGTYTVNYYFGESLFGSTQVTYGQYAEEPIPPSVEGKSFMGWYTADDQMYDFSTPVTGELNLYAQYGYAVVLCFGEDPIGAQVVEEGRCAIKPDDPAQEDKIFLGWYTADGKLYDFSAPVTQEIWLYAKWQDIPTFTDVPAGSFYEKPVQWALEKGITNGATETTFDPNGACLRIHVVTFLWRAAGKPEPGSPRNPFADVKNGDFFYKPVLWAVENGVTNGTSANTFGSYDICSRAQVVTFLWRAAGCPEPKDSVNPFVDVKSTDFFYKPVLWAVENGITNGLDANHFGPNAGCSRAQVATFLYRAYN